MLQTIKLIISKEIEQVGNEVKANIVDDFILPFYEPSGRLPHVFRVK